RIEIRHPAFTSAFACKSSRTISLSSAKVFRELAEAVHPVVAAADIVTVILAPVDKAQHCLVHVDAVDTILFDDGVCEASVLVAPERSRNVHCRARLGVEHVVRLEAKL